MKKHITLIVLLFFAVSAFGQNTKYVNAEILNVRQGAGIQYNTIGQVGKGSRVIVISENNGWTEIETTTGAKGFVATEYLSPENQNKHNENNNNDKKSSSWISVLITLGILGYVGLKVKKFFFGRSDSSNKLVTSGQTSNSPNPKPNKQEVKILLISDVRVSGNNYIETFDENGKKIDGKFLSSSSEKFVGFSQSCFITVQTNNYLTTYNAQCKKINGMFLNSSEHFNGCAGNTFTIKNNSKYVTTYDTNCKKISGRFV